jgi:hypothetical protein
LEDLTLVNVDWKGEFKRKVHLPSLRRFFLSRANWNIKETSAQDLMDSIFFYSNAAALKTWNQSLLYRSKATLRLEEPGASSIYQFSLNFEQNRLFVRSFPEDLTKYFSFTELNLWGTFWDLNPETGGWVKTRLTLDLALLPTATLRKLSLTNVNLISTSVLPPKFEALEKLKLRLLCFNSTQAIFPNSTLKYLELYGVKCDGRKVDVSSFLRNRIGLTSLVLSYSGSFDLSDLEASRRTLRYLGLEAWVVTQSADFQFPNLKLISLFGDVPFEPPQLFSTTFENSGVMEFVDFSFKPGFFKEVLKTRVRFIDFRLQRKAKVDWAAEVESFSAQAGVPKYLDLDQCQFRWTNGTWTCDYEEDIKFISNLRMARERDVVMCAYTLSLVGICSLGILGNVLSGGVLSRKRMRSSTTFILLGLTLSDLTLLLTSLFSVAFYGLKLILVFFNYPIKAEDYGFLWMDIHVADVGTLEHRQSQILYPLIKTGNSKSNSIQFKVAVITGFHAYPYYV